MMWKLLVKVEITYVRGFSAHWKMLMWQMSILVLFTRFLVLVVHKCILAIMSYHRTGISNMNLDYRALVRHGLENPSHVKVLEMLHITEVLRIVWTWKRILWMLQIATEAFLDCDSCHFWPYYSISFNL
jgi:hypothetical protein